MVSDYTDSDDDRDHRRSRKNKRRSRSRSYTREKDRDRSRKSKKSKQKRQSRSDSHSSERRNRRRSRSRSSEYNHKSSRYHDRRRSRSRSHSRSRSDHDSRRSSRSRDSHRSGKSKTSEDRGKDKRKNAELAEKKLQKALKAAVTADEILRAQGVLDEDVIRTKTSQLTFEEQQKRASAINDIESGEFVQESFKSSRSEIPLPSGSAVDASHTGAMFSTGPTKKTVTVPASVSCSLPTHSDSMMHPNLYIGVEEKMERWKQKVIELRKQKLGIV